MCSICERGCPDSVQGEVVLSGRCCCALTLLPAALRVLAVAEVSRCCLLFTRLLLCPTLVWEKAADGLSSSVTLARWLTGQDRNREEP
ncbi:hypothetical protein PFLUV_G00246030 [Perca fluviatilis]|uniref:Uncharacterized protein n=1 Tax=Perca fluviatilis TaxID=8168 RepID=A0A6A5DPU0_PERFL|nr:hypothetical protein PFLUV_G00246030 [Perca fluviatilis]